VTPFPLPSAAFNASATARTKSRFSPGKERATRNRRALAAMHAIEHRIPQNGKVSLSGKVERKIDDQVFTFDILE
jgi:hypothetical protein